MLKQLAFSAANDRAPRHMEKALAALHQGLRVGERVALEIGACQQRVGFFVRCNSDLEPLILGPLTASYPQMAMADVSDDQIPEGWTQRIRMLELRPQLFPILRHAQFEDLLQRTLADPIDAVLRSVLPAADSCGRLQLEMTPASARLHYRARRAVETLERSIFRNKPRLADWFASHCLCARWLWATAPVAVLARATPVHHRDLDTSAGPRHEREADLQAAADKVGGHLFCVRMTLTAWGVNDQTVQSRLRLMTAALGAFTRSRLATFRPSRASQTFLMSQEELATLWHAPLAASGVEQLTVATFRECEPPPLFASGDGQRAIPLGQLRFRNDRRTVGIADDALARHMHIIGRSGTGKSTLLLNLIHAHITKGHGLAVIDPHGDLSDAALSLIPPSRMGDVVVFDASDRDFAVGFNPLACYDSHHIDQVAGGIVAAFQKLSESWGPRLADLLRNGAFATVEQGGTLLSLLQLLSDAAYREQLVPRIRDPVVRHFWERDFSGWSKAYRTEAVAAVQNKVRPFLTSPLMRAIVSQRTKSLNLRQIMDDGKILIVNLSKGRIGDDNSTLLGALLIASLQQAAMTRADIPEHERSPFHLIVDEFQNFAGNSFATLLSESRKFGVSCVLAHQFGRQLPEDVSAAVLGNVGSTVAFAVSFEDADPLASNLGSYPGQLTSQDLMNLPKHTAYVRLLIDGSPSSPFTITTFPPPIAEDNRAEKVRQCSRRQYAQPIAVVLKEIEAQLAA